MTTDENMKTIEENLKILWEDGFDDGGFYNGDNPRVTKALDWLVKNHTDGEDFVRAIKECIRAINDAQYILAKIDNDLHPQED